MTTDYLKNENGEIAYEETGSGPLVICIPGMGDLRRGYRFLLPQLAAGGFRAVSLDVRGHGESSVGWADYSVAGVGSDVVALIRHLNSGPAYLLGASMGAGAAVWAAAEAPERVSGLVLLGPFVRSEPNALTNLLYRVMFARPWGPAMWLVYYNTLYPTHKPADFQDYQAALKTNLGEAGRLEALQQMLFASKSASERRLSSVRAPALVLMGSQDPDFKRPEDEAQWVAQSLKGQYAMIAGAGHYPHAEMPEVTGSRILAFLSNSKPV
jgi:pimeloyl-ACP methyl ester carboxylesterase